MPLDKQKLDELVALISRRIPNWNSFSDPRFVKDEVDYKQVTVTKARDLLSEGELQNLIAEGKSDEFLDRLKTIGKDNNPLWDIMPATGDLNIIRQSELDKPSFCREVFDLLYGPGPSHERLGRYTEYVKSKGLPNRWTFPTYFLFMCHPDTEIFVKPRVLKWFLRFLGGEFEYSSAPTAENYSSIRGTYQQLKEDLKDYGPKDMVDIQSFVWSCWDISKSPPGGAKSGPDFPPGVPNLIDRIQSILERKGQVILYGPPGTGKTYWAEKAAYELAAQSNFQKEFDQLPDHQRYFITGDGDSFGAVRTCCFHPAYGYEDFIEGYRPEQADGQMIFTLRDGVFKRLCKDALDAPETSFYLIIDEINRGDIPRIIGELMTILEKDKRGKSITLPTSGEQFKVPSNVHIIGTMNTADRSIALLDAALRRRFGFIELMPDPSVLGDSTVKGINLGGWLDALNRKICDHVVRDARNLQIGHSYLLKDDGTPIADFSEFARALHEEIIPLLEEYCYEDYTTLEKILGSGIVDANDQKIRHELFKLPGHEELIQALELTSLDAFEE
ncbi:MAG TPA: AAA domain-containing protein [Methanotrichaceae archaeon]|nr:AAA domain-containing protein [Methanotrichaceae archaeon]